MSTHSAGRSPRARRLAVRGSAGLVGAGFLVAGVLQATGLLAGGGPGQKPPPLARPSLSIAAMEASIAASGDGQSTFADAMRKAEATRKRTLATQRRSRELERVRREERRRAEALAANQVVSAPSPAAPVRSAPAPPVDPWAHISPMERQTTPGPWNNGGETS